MKFGVYSMRDSVSGLYNNPTFEMDDQIAIRNFRFSMNKTDFLSFNPHDFDFFKIGEFENTTGMFTPMEPKKLIDGVSVMEKD